MITDAQNRPTTVSQVIAGAAGTTVSTDSIDMLTANRNIGRGFPMRMHVAVTVALAGGTSIQAQLIESANANLSSPTVLASGAVVPLASATAGAELLDVPIPGTTKRYLGLQFVTLGTFTGSGAVQGNLVAETDNQPYITMNTGL
jgi:hypothetical protein